MKIPLSIPCISFNSSQLVRGESNEWVNEHNN